MRLPSTLSWIVLFLCLNLPSSNAFLKRFSRQKDKEQNEKAGPAFIEVVVHHNGDEENGKPFVLTKEDCNNADALVSVVCPAFDESKSCSLHNRVGKKVSSCSDVASGDLVFIVPPHRIFIMPTFVIGHVAVLDHIEGADGTPVILETISKQPRVFRIRNFHSTQDSESLINNALATEEEARKLQRSRTGHAADSFRTSENTWDNSTEAAMRLKRRGFGLLGLDAYNESWSDGLQLLRYNLTTAYSPHYDYMGAIDGDHDYNSAGEGSNRFATILLYLSDVDDGGETVFPLAAQPGREKMSRSEADDLTTAYLEQRGVSELFPLGSWQRSMVVDCRTQLALKPKNAEAVLFYNQGSDGQIDMYSKHGGCPVIEGSKWAANLWVWNNSNPHPNPNPPEPSSLTLTLPQP